MKKMIIIITAMLALGACQGNKGDQGVSGSKGDQGDTVVVQPTPQPSNPAQDAVNTVLAEENSYRRMLGQSELTRGLSCTVSKFVSPSNPTTIYNSPGNTNKVGTVTTAFTYTLDAVINQLDSPVTDGLSILPVQFRGNPLYQSWYLLRCSGHLVVTETNYYNFELQSDDGSILSLDGTQLINMDGNHAVTTGLGSKLLRRGAHSLKLEYIQSGGSQALILKAGGTLIDPIHMAH